MKQIKRKKTALLGLTCLLTLGLFSCSQKEGGTESLASSEASSSDNQVKSDPYGSPWGEQIASIFYDYYGQDIPFPYGTTSVKYGVGVDDYGDPMIVLFCSFETVDDIDAAIEQYSIDAVNRGYNVVTLSSVDNGHPAYDCSIPYFDVMTLRLQICYGGADLDGDGENEDYLGIFVTSETTVDPYFWPYDLINNVIGDDKEIPAFEGEGITYNSTEVHDSEFGNYVSITVYGVVESDLENYHQILVDAGYNVTWIEEEATEEDEVAYSYYLAWKDDSFFIQFNSGSYQNQAYMDINIALGDVYDHFKLN